MAEWASTARTAAIEASGIRLVALHDALERVCKSAHQSVKGDSVMLNVLTQDAQVFVAEYPRPKKKKQPVPMSNAGCREVVLSEATVNIYDSTKHPVMCIMPWSKAWKAYLGVPVLFGDQVLGSLCTVDADCRTWTPKEIAALEMGAEQVGEILKSRRGVA